MKRKTLIFIVLLALLGVAVQGLSVQRKGVSSSGRQKTALPVTGLHLIENSDARIVLDWEAPELSLERDVETHAVVGVDLAGISPFFEAGVPRLPKLSEILDAYAGDVSVQLVSPEYEALRLGECLAMPEDFILDARDGVGDRDDPHGGLGFRERMLVTEKKSGLWPERSVEVVETGVYRGHRLVALHLNPVQVDTRSGEGRLLRRARIIVSLPPMPENQVRLPDSPNETNALRDMLGALKCTALSTRAPEERQARDSVAGLDEDFPVWNVNRWKIYVRETSIIRMTGDYLRAVGVPVDDITPWDLHITHKGREIPIVVEGQEDGDFDDYDHITFFGERNEKTYFADHPSMHEDPLTIENCYMLWWGDGISGLRLGEQDGSWQPSWNADPVRSVRVTLHFEKDRIFNQLSSADNYLLDDLRTGGPLGPKLDHWFWEDYISAQTSRNFDVFVPFPNRNPPYSFGRVVVRTALTGFSANYPGWNHYVCVSMNSISDSGLCYGRQYEGDSRAAWLGQTPVVFETLSPNPASPDSGVNIRTEDLINGSNIITVSVPGNAIAGDQDKILVNWFEVEYERDLRSRSGVLQFHFDHPLGDTVSYDIRGFSNSVIEVWKLGRSRLTSLETRRVTPSDESASWAVRFPVVSDGEYDILAFGQNYINSPFLVIPDTVQIDLRNHTGAEYVLIAHDSYFADSSLHILDSLRHISFDNSVLTVPLSEVYEQFSHGLVTPHAIRDFLKYAYDHWSVRPTHCCLVGDAVTKQRDGVSAGDQIPTFTPITEDYGASPTDYLFGCVAGPEWDIIPDIAIGRISCRTPAQLATYVQKVLAYENNLDYEGLFQSNVLFIADHTDRRGGINDIRFGQDFSEPALRAGSPCLNVSRVYLDSIASGQGPIKLRDALRDGAVVVNYNGHGGGGVWSGSELIDVSGVRLLNNRDAFPFVTNFTCYVGAFDSPTQADVLGEAFIFTRNNNNDLIGGIGFYSSSGVGWALTGRNMQQYLFDFLLEPPARTLGESALLNKAHFWSAQSQVVSYVPAMGMMVMMNLLGDPGIRLALPRESLSPQMLSGDHFVSAQDTIAQDSVRIVVELPWDPSSSVTYLYALPYNGDIYRYTEENGEIDSDLLSSQVPAFDPQRVDFTLSQTQVCTTDVIRITNRFVTPRGNFVVYATDPLLKRSAVGCLPIFLADSLVNVQIHDIEVTSGDYVESGVSYYVRATILHQDDLASVRFRNVFRPAQGPVQIDSMSMEPVGPGLWQTARWLGPFDVSGGRIQVRFYVTPNGGTEYESPYYDLPLEGRTDFSLTGNPHLVAEERAGTQPYYMQPVTAQHYFRTSPAEEVAIRLTAVRDSSYIIGGQTFTVTVDSFTVDHVITSLDSGETLQEVMIPTTFTPGQWDVEIVVDPEDEYDELSSSNNVRNFSLDMPLVYPCTRAAGTAYWRPFVPVAAHRVWNPGETDTLALRILPNRLGVDSAAIHYGLTRDLSDSEISSLIERDLYQPFSQSEHGPFSAMFADSALAIGPEFEAIATLTIVGYDTLRRAVQDVEYGLFYRDPARPEWRRARNEGVTLVAIDTFRVFPIPNDPRLDTLVVWRLAVEGTIQHLGEIAVFDMRDASGPHVEVAAGGLRFTQNAIIPSHPQLFVTISDINGVQRGPGSFHIVLDGDTIEADELSWSDSVTTAAALTAMFEPSLDPGAHVLDVFAEDCNYNTTDFSTEFEVRGEFGIEWAINYPNPFKKNTTIAYALTGVTDDYVEIKVYTVSGRLIRTWRENERAVANYRSWIWGGTDDDGNEVANGVYFAKIKAKQGDQEVEEIVKLAKLR